MQRQPKQSMRSLLSRAALFAHVERAAIDRACAAAIKRKLTSGTVLFREGEAAERLHLVIDGRVKMTRVAPNGAQSTIGVLGPGELAGCVAVFRKIPYPATATSAGETITLSWSCAQMQQMLELSQQLGKNALTIVGERAERFLRRTQELSSDSAEQRVARALLRMLDPGVSRIEPPTVVTNRQDLADLSGVTLYTASRVIAELERRGLLKGGRQKIVVMKPGGLQAIAEARGG